ncbi:MAG: hypothetical protein Q9202_006124 [Teloschistes flavicans]
MGGFVLDTYDPDRPTYIPNSPRLSITANGIAILAECGHLPDISRGEIVDKSKADNVAKSLAILQASWLLLQCIARTADGLPLTLLELNTLAHTICALAMYILWWNKPYDVHESVPLSGDWVRPLSSAMWMFSRISTENQVSKTPEIEKLIQVDISTTPSQQTFPYRRPSHTNGGPPMPTDDATETVGDTFIAADSAPSIPLLPLQRNGQKLHVQYADSILDLRVGEVVQNSIVPHDSQAHMEAGWPTLSDSQVHAGTGFGPRRESEHFRVLPGASLRSQNATVSIKLSSTTLTRWHLAVPVLESYPHVWYRYRQPCERRSEFRDDIPVFEYPASLLKREFVVNEIATWPGSDLVEGRLDDYGLRIFALLFITSAYGGLHAAAWKDYFPSVTERIMWRVSSLIIAASVPIFMCGAGVPILGSLLFILYVASRFFLVVEALISLRQLPVAMYETPRFVQYIPHL